MRYWAEGLPDNYLTDLAGPFHIEQAVASYHVGMRALSEGDLKKAREHLSIAASTGPVGWWYTLFAEAYVNLIDQGRLPAK